jgi:glycerol uptake facilitator-like aquaporin
LAEVSTHGAALWRRLLAEYLGTLFLALVVVGSGIAAQTLSPHALGLELLENGLATAGGLFVIILMFGAVSGAHLNPVVSLVDAAFGGMRWRDAAAYVVVQIVGCMSGAIVANVMFSRAAVSISTHNRASGGHFLAEVIATSGLLILIFALAYTGRSALAPSAVGSYIGAAYFFTSSTSFANPAIDVGRMLTNSFAGIAPASVPSFVLAELVGALVGYVVIRALYPGGAGDAARVVVPHEAHG